MRVKTVYVSPKICKICGKRIDGTYYVVIESNGYVPVGGYLHQYCALRAGASFDGH